MADAASPSSKSGRATACRTSRRAVSTADKIEFVDRLSAAGLPVIEVSAFVSPKWVPQMADAGRGVRRHHAPAGHALHRAGAEPRGPRARASRPASPRSRSSPPSTETFSRRNINQIIDESLATYAAGVRRALAAGLRVRGYLSTAFGCPFEGAVAAERVADVAERAARASACSRSRSATRSASRIPARCRACSTPCWRASRPIAIALHFHDTRGTALANVLAALPFGIDDVRRVGRRPRRLPVRAGRGRQPRDRRSDLHAGRAGDRDRRRPRRRRSRRRGSWRAGGPFPRVHVRCLRKATVAARKATGSASLHGLLASTLCPAAPPSTPPLARPAIDRPVRREHARQPRVGDRVIGERSSRLAVRVAVEREEATGLERASGQREVDVLPCQLPSSSIGDAALGRYLENPLPVGCTPAARLNTRPRGWPSMRDAARSTPPASAGLISVRRSNACGDATTNSKSRRSLGARSSAVGQDVGLDPLEDPEASRQASLSASIS